MLNVYFKSPNGFYRTKIDADDHKKAREIAHLEAVEQGIRIKYPILVVVQRKSSRDKS